MVSYSRPDDKSIILLECSDWNLVLNGTMIAEAKQEVTDRNVQNLVHIWVNLEKTWSSE